jgi:hypothetical protein
VERSRRRNSIGLNAGGTRTGAGVLVIDAILVGLSAANTLHQDLSALDFKAKAWPSEVDPLRVFAEAAGRFADACEKLDHLEDSYTMARDAKA